MVDGKTLEPRTRPAADGESESQNRKGQDNASATGRGSSDRRGSSLVAGESLHSHARVYQVHLEWRGGYRRCVMAPECIRAISLDVTDTHRPRVKPDARSRTIYQSSQSSLRKTADSCHKELL